jgi:2-polyprenyl-3-methyl-5-hydroxy-6-metoxy-1,4-benzoquinol methylase
MNKIKVEKNEWDKAQKGELSFHKINEWRKNDELFSKANYNLFNKTFGFGELDYENKHILDLGCGSKLRVNFFKNAFIHALEPLAEKFISEIEWCDLKSAHKVYSLPAEELVQNLVGNIDFVVSINVIDHCYDFELIIKNVYKYLKPDGLCLLSFDLHDKIDEMHPIIVTDEFSCRVFERNGFKIEKKIKTPPYHKGISELSMSYFLKKNK